LGCGEAGPRVRRPGRAPCLLVSCSSARAGRDPRSAQCPER
jgi:hypothetical protein